MRRGRASGGHNLTERHNLPNKMSTEVTTKSGTISRNDPLADLLTDVPKEVRNLIAGGCAGMVAKTFVAPVDRIKIMYQITEAHFRIRDVPGVAFRIVKEEGFSALWKGNVATLIRVFPYSGIQFMVFDRMKIFFLTIEEEESKNHWLLDENEPSRVAKRTTRPGGLTPFESLISGSTAGAVSVMATYPLDLTRAQLAVLKKKKKKSANKSGTFAAVLTRNYTEGGVKGLYRGITPTLLGILPYSGVAFTMNEQAKRKIKNVTGKDPTTIQKMQCGALAGLFAQSMTYPLEVTRRRMQTIGIVRAAGTDAAVNVLGGTIRTSKAHRAAQIIEKEPSMLSTVTGVMREQGLRGLFKGVSMNWVKGPIAFSISFTTFDLIQGKFGVSKL